MQDRAPDATADAHLGPKRLLVPLLGDNADRDSLHTAAHLAQRFASRVDGLYLPRLVSDILPYSAYGVGGFAWSQDMIAQVEDNNRQSLERARQAFDTLLAGDGGAMRGRWIEGGTAGAQPLGDIGRFYDLIITTRSGDTPDSFRRNLLEAALFDCARPALAVPQGLSSASFGQRVAIAWNGGSQAMRAVIAGLPFLTAAQQVTAVQLVDPDARDDLDALAGYLDAHNIPLTRERLDETGRVGERLVAAFEEIGADMVIMGAYGHSRMREWVFGGVTEYFLDSCALPMLFAH
ncbi:MAG: universal stress protein [Rhodothalassiaceae bacterium]